MLVLTESQREFMNKHELLLDEAPTYKLFPKFKTLFKTDAEARKIERMVNDLKTLAHADGEELFEKRSQVWKVVRAILVVWADLGYVMALPFILFVTPLIGIAVNRLIRYAVDTADFENEVKNARQVISQMEKVKSSIKDPAKKKRIDDQIIKIQKTIRQMENN